MTAALLNQLRERVRDPDPAVSGAARLDLVELAAGLSRGAWHLWRARRSADPATRLRALASDARRGPRQFQSAIDALLSAGTENVAVPPDVLLTVLGAAPRLRDHRHDTVQRTTLVRLATEGYWRGRALDALADYHLANGEVTEAVFVLAPALDAVGDVPAERQISLLRLAAIQSRRRAAKGWDAERDGMDDIEGRALVAAMALPGPHAAAAARRLAALRTAQGSFYDAERLWAHARELRVRAPESAGSGWIDSYKSLTNVGDGSYTWKRDDSLPVEDDAIPEGRDWGLVGEPGDTLVRREVTMPSSGRRAGCLLLDRVATPGHPVVLLDSWDKAIEVSMWEADVAARWWASFQSEARLCLPPSIDSSTPVTEHGRSRRIEPEIEVLMLDVAVRADCAVPADISKALGWARKLVWAIFALQRALEPQPGMPSQYEARDYLQNVALGAGGAVMAVLRPSNGGRPAPLDVARLIDCFWRLELSLLDNAERASYATVMDRARTYLIAERTTVGPDSTRPEAMVGADGDSDMAPFTIVARAQARAAAAVERAREGTRPRGFDNTLRNAADAARGLESGAAFTAFPELIDAEVLELIERVAVLIPPRARDLRAQLP